MKKFSKITAILLALVLVLSCFTACGEAMNTLREKYNEFIEGFKSSTDDGVNTDDQGSSDTENTGTDYSNPSLNIGGVEVDTENLTVITLNGIEIPFDEFRYVYCSLNNYYGFSPEYFDANPGLFEQFMDVVEEYTVSNYWGEILAKEYGIELNDDDKKEIADALQAEKDAFESEEAYQQALVESGITEDLLTRVITQSIFNDKVYEELYGENGRLVGTDEELKQGMEQDYCLAHHLLISFDHYADDEDYKDASEEELKAAALALANDCLAKIQSGEADLYQMAQDLGDDPGMLGNEEGYFFTYGEMVEPFEEKSFELGIGETSGLVETSYGWHIITKLDHKAYIEADFDNLRSTYIDALFNRHVDKIMDEAEITYFADYDKIESGSIK